jgi:hypothetical protein
MVSYDSQNKQLLFLSNSIDQLIFVMEKRCVFYEVVTDFYVFFRLRVKRKWSQR